MVTSPARLLNHSVNPVIRASTLGLVAAAVGGEWNSNAQPCSAAVVVELFRLGLGWCGIQTKRMQKKIQDTYI